MAVKKSTETIILPISGESVYFYIIGTQPLIMNRMAEKAKRELLLPFGRRRTEADRAGSLKHEPLEEYRASAYRNIDSKAASLLMFPASSFKRAMATAALDLPGTKKTEIGRLVWITGHSVDMFGVPELLMSVVRNSDVNHTPDIRTRAILPRWACKVEVNYVVPKLNATAIYSLLSAAGIIAGIGDGRQEKGALSYGQFRVTTEASDPEYRAIVKEGSRKAQMAAFANVHCHDYDSDDLLRWFMEEAPRRAARRKQEEASPRRARKPTNGKQPRNGKMLEEELAL